jgi:arginine:ornithine antiporter / lysine permease
MAPSPNEADQKLSRSALIARVVGSMVINRTMPSFLASVNARQAPAGALCLTNWVIQAFLLITWFAEYTFTLALKMTSAMTPIPYFFVAAYGLKLAYLGETYHASERAPVATIYAAAMIYAGGPKFLLLSAILYAPRRLLFFLAKRERKETVFKPLEAAMFAALAIAACAGVYALAAGAISI